MTKIYKNLTLIDVREIKRIILKGLKSKNENYNTILQIAKSIALDFKFYNICNNFYDQVEETKQIYLNSRRLKKFKELKKYSRKCNDLWLSAALESLSNL